MSTHEHFARLDPRVQKWVYSQGWFDLREIQREAVEPILSSSTDVVISASTAAGKTEAAFLPAISATADMQDGFGILYVSPLKALINDQFRRLTPLGEMLDMPITPWHGDSPQSLKDRVKRDPRGVVLITPESLESLLVREPGWVRTAFELLRYIIIDEYHAFIGLERGMHLQSLMHRLENLLDRQGRPVPRIALSATLGDMDSVAESIRQDRAMPCKLIIGAHDTTALKIQLRGYKGKDVDEHISREGLNDLPLPAEEQIARQLFELLRGDSHLVFANSRKRTEYFAVLLRELCARQNVPNEFYPHHGSLSNELRTYLESRLQKETLPTTAICTMTLELGIDIGKVKSIAQVTAPHTVSSLRQRLGRSGRRGDPAVLRMFITENELTPESHIIDLLRIELLQSIAMVRLLVREKWYEPADLGQFHFSTLLHQILAVIAQWGGVRADQLYALLCKTGPFRKVAVNHFKTLLNQMGELRLISQLSSGELVLGDVGEKITGSFHFYAVFKTPEEYRIVVEGKTLGTLPVNSMIIPRQHIVFGGRRWKVQDVDNKKNIIHVTAARGGKPPKFGDSGMSVHGHIRHEMLKVYIQGDYRIEINGMHYEFLDETARDLFDEGLRFFRLFKLEHTRITSIGNHVYIIPWVGDKIVNTLTVLLLRAGFKASSFAGIIEIEKAVHAQVSTYLKQLCNGNAPSDAELARLVRNKNTEKYDNLLPDELLALGYGAKAFDIDNTIGWIEWAKEKGMV